MAIVTRRKSIHSEHSLQVVYTSVLGYFGARKALAAVALLDEACADGTFRPIEFVNYLTKTWSLDVAAKTVLRKELFRNSGPGVALKKLPARREKSRQPVARAVPSSQVTYLPTARKVEQPDVSSAAIVFSLVVRGLLRCAKVAHPAQYEELVMFFRQELCDLDLARNIRAEFRAWDMSLEVPCHMPPLSEGQMAGVVQSIYNAMCAALGPIAADSILTRVMNKVETHDVALEFSPRNFL